MSRIVSQSDRHMFLTDIGPDPDALGPCGCTDYHMADCPLVTGQQDDEPEPDDDRPDYDD